MSEWQDIESAPKDGSWVYIWCDFVDGHEPRIARYVADHTPNVDKPFGPFVWATQDGKPNIGTIAEKVAKLWQPLPNPPHLDRGTADT
jgi:hypothetical protein